MIKLAVFDWNGTVLADVAPTVASFNRQLDQLGHAPVSRRVFLESFDTPVHHTFTNIGIDLLAYDEAKRLASARDFHAYYETLITRARTRRGARAVLRDLTERGVTCIVLSNHTAPEIRVQIKRLKLEPFFAAVLAHDRIGRSHHEDKQQYLEAYLRQNHFKPAEAVIIGDSVGEVRIGRALGLKTIALTGGFTSAARLRRAKPDILLHKMADVAEAIEALR